METGHAGKTGHIIRGLKLQDRGYQLSFLLGRGGRLETGFMANDS